jgi:hypothetical protein
LSVGFFRGEEKMTFWLVENRYYDDGVEIRCVGSLQAEKLPDGEKVSTSEVDIYRDWFDSRTAADRLVEAVRDFEPVQLRRPA